MIQTTIDRVYEVLDGPSVLQDFIKRCGITSLNVLTVLSEQDARETVLKFKDSIAGRRVVEIGSGVGYLALEMAKVAKSVIAIENDPAWSWVFTKFLYRRKPPNLTWIFGHSETVNLSADVAVICSRSGLAGMIAEARRLAPKIVLICCAEVVVCESDDPMLDALADYSKAEIARIFAAAEDALQHPEKRAAFQGDGPSIDWERMR